MQSRLRVLSAGDAEALLAYFRRLVAEDPERVERPEDASRLTVEDERQWIASRETAERAGEMSVLCIEEERRIVAVGEVERMRRWIERHVAELRFGCLPDRIELALPLVEQLVLRAEAMGIEVLVYFHLATQARGLEVVRRAGFEECGRIPGYYRKSEGDIDRVYFTRRVR
jgi:hypothetical protein